MRARIYYVVDGIVKKHVMEDYSIEKVKKWLEELAEELELPKEDMATTYVKIELLGG